MDFNAKFSKWCSTYKTTPQGAKLDNLTSQYELTQLLKEPTNIFENYRSCIDLSFTSQPNLVVEFGFGLHPNLHENCHYQIIYSKFDLKTFYRQPYEKLFGIINKSTGSSLKDLWKNFNGKTLSQTVIQMSKYL